MTPERHQLVKMLFEGARRRQGAERERFLAEQGAGHATACHEARSLLAYHDEQPEFLREPALGEDFRLPGLDDPADVPRAGGRIGRYEIVRILGEGGMGVVYEAQQESPRRRVALKVIRPRVTSPTLLRRFRHEAQTLARLRHPGIAQIYEAGTFRLGAAPQPFFAMELIEGRPLTEHARAQALSSRARLELLARVADAVDHAHRHGVVHRDLKPANILVEESGQPKILDFGVARATDSDLQATTLRTDAGQLLGTVPYMSPEQVAADTDALDARSDVYALGVTGYELLTGRLPLGVHDKTIPEAARIIRDVEPPRLGSIVRAFHGDVETIIGKALEKDRDRRYASAALFAADIRRHLADEPIRARPASTLYQLRKFARRHRALVAGVALAFVALLAATVVSTVFWHRAESRGTELATALGRAEVEAGKAAAINEFLVGMLRSADPRRDTSGITVREVLDRAAGSVDEAFAGQPLVRAAVERTIADSYAGLGLYEAGLPHAETAVALHAVELGDDDPETLRSINLHAGLLDWLGRCDEALPLFTRALEGRRRVLGEDHRETLAAGTNVGLVEYRVGRRAEAETRWTAILATCRAALPPTDPVTLNVMTKLAWLYHEDGRGDEAERFYVEVLAVRTSTLGDRHPATLETMTSLGRLHIDQGRYEEAEALLTRAIETQRSVLGREHTETLRTMQNLGWLYTRLGRLSEAETIHTEELEVRRRLNRGVPYALNSLAICYEAQGRLEEGEALKIEALDIRRRTVGPDHPRTLDSMNNLAATYFRQGRYEEAERLWTEVLATRRSVLSPDHPDLLNSLNNVGLLYATQGRYDEAEPLYRETLETRRRILGADNWYTINSIGAMGRLYHDTGRYAEAAALLDEAVAGARRTLPADHWYLGVVLRYRGDTHAAEQEPAAARSALAEAYRILMAARGAEHDETRAAETALARLGAEGAVER